MVCNFKYLVGHFDLVQTHWVEPDGVWGPAAFDQLRSSLVQPIQIFPCDFGDPHDAVVPLGSLVFSNLLPGGSALVLGIEIAIAWNYLTLDIFREAVRGRVFWRRPANYIRSGNELQMDPTQMKIQDH